MVKAMNNVSKNGLALFLLIGSLALIAMGGLLKVWFVWALLGGICVLIFLQRQQYRQNLLIISILGFLTGWRGIDFSPSFIIYPTELFIWLGLLIYILDRLIKRQVDGLDQSKPMILESLLVVFAILGGVVSQYYGRPILAVLAPLKTFLVFIPMLILFRSWIQDRDQIVYYARLLVYVGCIISILGLIERYIPAVAQFLSKYMPTPVETRYNFEFESTIELAAFSSWGTPVVSTLLVLMAGLAALIPNPETGWFKNIRLLSLPVLTLAIIATGYRSAWLGLSLVMLLAVIFNGRQFLPLFALILPATFFLFSSVYIDRFRTVFFIENSHDTSFIIRSLALQNGLHIIQNNFFLGIGWGSNTSFNDWVNLGIAMGGVGLLIFIAWYGLLLVNLIGYAWKTRDLTYLSFFAALAGYTIAMISGAMTQVYPIMTGFWFVFCLGWRLIEISKREELEHAKIVRADTNL
jgi:hypothetical protein